MCCAYIDCAYISIRVLDSRKSTVGVYRDVGLLFHRRELDVLGCIGERKFFEEGYDFPGTVGGEEC